LDTSSTTARVKIIVVRRVQTTAADWIEANLEGGQVVTEKFVGGSNWSSAYVYTTAQGKEYFVKLAMGGRDDSMFQGEAQGLQAMYGEWQCTKKQWGFEMGRGVHAMNVYKQDVQVVEKAEGCRQQ
jgi:hypothetical protein